MSNNKTPIFFSANKFDHLPVCYYNHNNYNNNKPTIRFPSPEKISSVMWRSVAKQAISLHLKKPFSRAYSFLGISQDSILREKVKFGCLDMVPRGIHEVGSGRIGEILNHEDYMGRTSFGVLKNDNFWCPRGYATVAEAVSSTDVEEDVSIVEEIQELLQEMKKEEQREGENEGGRKRRRVARGMGSGKYRMLKMRQVKIETEAWEQAANEYRELLMDMCEQKLAPNLPYMKSLFLGWFEPLRDAIAKEQERCRMAKHKVAYAPYFDQLPADMMAVITMHKLMGLLMMGGEHGRARVVQAACIIGDAIEQEVGEIGCCFGCFYSLFD